MSAGRNDPCPCGSGRKYKHCHGAIAPMSGQSPQPAGFDVRRSLERAWGLHQQGFLLEAEALYQDALKRSPRNAEAMNMLGILCAQRGDPSLASEWIGKAISVDPQSPAYHFNLGKALRQLSRPVEAARTLERAVALRGEYAEALNELGLAQMEAGDLEASKTAFRRALSLQPRYFEAQNNLGLAWYKQGGYEEASSSFNRAMELDPRSAEARSNLGMVYRAQGYRARAAESYRAALALSSRDPVSLSNLGNAFIDLAEYGQAITCFREATTLAPDNAEAHCYWGTAYHCNGQPLLAAEKFSEVLARNPEHIEALIGLGAALHDLGHVDEAIATYRRLLKLRPEDAQRHSALLFFLLYSPGITSESLFAEHREWARKHAGNLASRSLPHRNSPEPERRLRVGYVSGDLRSHPVGYFFEPVLAHHERAGFEIFCYYNLAFVDALSERLRGLSDAWHVISKLDDAAVDELVRNDGIDILVDLSGHTVYNRLALFARKPAPVQATWLGYLGTTGLESVDYRITDRYASPEGLLDPFHTERLQRLPDSQWCYQAPADCPEVAELPAMKAGFVTFASLSTLAKIRPPAIELWCRLLERMPGARLVIVAKGLESIREEYLARFADRGIAAERVKLLGGQPFGDYLALHNSVDLILDTFPYAGGTTTTHALWMGVPVVSLAGDTSPSRSGASLLSVVGLQELVAETPEQYLDIASELAGDLPRLSALRSGMRKRMTESALMDPVRFTRNLEQAYRSMWRRWCDDRKAS
ncbi:MAG TPA: tetratricopeptide repeat protein [Burkholderiales bacterium]